jgi:hypothetical protein
MRLISRATCPDEVRDCDYALIDLTPSLARLGLSRIARLKEHKASDNDLLEIYFWDYHALYFSPWIAEDCGEADVLAEKIECLPSASEDLSLAPDDFAVSEQLCTRVECCQMIATEDGIAFVAIAKHTSFYITTAEIPITLLEKAAAERSLADSHLLQKQ